MVCVELKDVSYRYPTGEKRALKHVSLQVQKGEFVAVIGKNGAGPKQAAQYCGQENRSRSGWIREIELILLPEMIKK